MLFVRGQLMPQNLMDAINRVPTLDIKYFIEGRKRYPGFNFKMVEAVTIELIPKTDLRLVSIWLRDSRQTYGITVNADNTVESIDVLVRCDNRSFQLQKNIFVLGLSNIKFNLR
jgi:hypothetical protein